MPNPSPSVKVAVVWLGRVSRDTAGRTYLTELLEPLGRCDGLVVDVHLGDPDFAVPATCLAIQHRVPYRLGSAARVLMEAVVAAGLRGRYDVVLAPFNNLPASWRGPSVVVQHNVLAFATRVPEVSRRAALWRRFALRLSITRATKILAVSAYLRGLLLERYPSLDPARVEVVPLGVSPRLARPTGRRLFDPEAPQFIAVSALWRYKRIDEAIETFADVAGKLAHARLVVAGPGGPKERARLEAIAEALGVLDRVEFAGNVEHSELARLYAASDLLLYLSELESFGMPVLEAMLAGVPVVAKRTPGVAEVGGDAALWIKPGTPRAERAQAVSGLLDDPALRQEYVDRGLRRAAGFTWTRAAELTAEALADAVALGRTA